MNPAAEWDRHYDEMEADAHETWRHKIEQLVRDYDNMEQAKVRMFDDGTRFEIIGHAHVGWSYQLDGDEEWSYLTDAVVCDHVEGESSGIAFWIHPRKTVDVTDLYDEEIGLAYDDDAIAQAIAQRLVDSIADEVQAWLDDVDSIDTELDQLRIEIITGAKED